MTTIEFLKIQLRTLNQHLSETLIPNLCWRRRLQIDSKRPYLYPFEKGTTITVELYFFLVLFHFTLILSVLLCGIKTV